MRVDLPLVSYEFEGVDGRIHAFSGCSLVGKFEFDARLEELVAALQAEEDEAVTLPQLYLADVWIRWLCDRLFTLNGIDPNWISPAQLEALLFGRIDDAGNVVPGILIEINQPKSASPSARPTEPQGLADIIAALSHDGGIGAALELVQTVPANLLLEIAEKRAEQLMTPEQKDKHRFDDWAARKREQMMSRAVGDD